MFCGFIGFQALGGIGPRMGSLRFDAGLIPGGWNRGPNPGPPNAGTPLDSPGLGLFGSANRTING